MLGTPQAAPSHTASGWALGQALQEVHCTKPRHLGLKPVPALGETEELVFSSPAALGYACMHGAGGARCVCTHHVPTHSPLHSWGGGNPAEAHQALRGIAQTPANRTCSHPTEAHQAATRERLRCWWKRLLMQWAVLGQVLRAFIQGGRACVVLSATPFPSPPKAIKVLQVKQGSQDMAALM